MRSDTSWLETQSLGSRCFTLPNLLDANMVDVYDDTTSIIRWTFTVESCGCGLLGLCMWVVGV